MLSGPGAADKDKLCGQSPPEQPSACRRSAIWPLLLLLLTASASGQSLPTLRTAHEVQSLTQSEAARGYPVHFERAQITFVQSCPGLFFLMDATGGFRVQAASQECGGLRTGDLVSVDATTAAGAAAPLLVHPSLRIHGHSALPSAPLVSLDLLQSGAWDARWVTVQGIIESSAPDPRNPDRLVLKITSGQDQLDVVTAAAAATDPPPVDATVRLRGVVDNVFNSRKLLVDSRLLAPDLSSLRIVEHPVADPFALPVIRIGDIGMPGTVSLGHRIHTRGVITSAWGDDHHFSMMGEGAGIFVTSESPVVLQVGTLVDVVGFPANGDYSIYLDYATLRRIGTSPVPPPMQLSAAQALSGGHDAEPIETEGIITEIWPGPNNTGSLLVDDSGTSLIAVLPAGHAEQIIRRFQLGSRVRVTGICVIHTDPDHNPRELNILVGSAADLVLLRTPPWWTVRHALLLAAILAGVALVVIVWNALLSRRVRAQTRQIRTQLDESRKLREQAEAAHQEKTDALANLMIVQKDLLIAQEKLRFQATHDPLTGLWNRAALLDALHREVARMLRSGSPMAVLLLDVDHFKQVNDTQGHLAGDAVLLEIGRRITSHTRPYDVAGRYGGEEFLVILPECAHDDAWESADRIRLAIAATPLRTGDSEVSLTISIGATVAFDQPESEAALLREADAALYQAKSEGRNRTVLYRG